MQIILNDTPIEVPLGCVSLDQLISRLRLPATTSVITAGDRQVPLAAARDILLTDGMRLNFDIQNPTFKIQH